MPMVDERRKVLRNATRAAGDYLRQMLGGDLQVTKKGNLDLVTQADQTAEKLVVDTIVAACPHDGILAEEGSHREGSNAYQWIIDPLDGTTNFTHGLPHFAVSVALAQAGKVISGVVYDPAKDEWFEAHRGEGATLNGHPLQVTATQALNECLAVTGFSYNRRERMDVMLARVQKLLNHCRGMRRLGAAALDLAYVAAGRFDVYLEDGLNAWDIAAGVLLVEEAGGRTAGFDGGPVQLQRGDVLATNAALFQAAHHTLL